MSDDCMIEYERNTVVCNHSEADMEVDQLTGSLLALINHHVFKGSRSMSDIAADLGISRRQLGRMLSGRRPLRIAEFRALTHLLQIDRTRAIVAIELIGDWKCYDDPGLNIVMHLLPPVVSKLRDRAEFAIQPLTKPAQNRLSDWLANTIITNEEQIRHRRDTFINLPEI